MGIPRKQTVRKRLMCAVALGAVLVAGPVWAQARSFKIPPLPAAGGVTEFARQAGVQILAPAEATQGKRTAAVSGSMSVGQALETLLAGTGLVVTANDGRTIILAPQPARMTRVRWGPETSSTYAAAELAEAAPSAPAVTAVDEVVVTGTHLSGFSAPTPVTEVGAAQITQKAAGTVSEVLRDIPQFASSTGPANASSGAQSASKATIGLYNLGATRTLVLVNGNRHVADGTGNVFDTNLIPVSLVERVDIVTGGASAAYGSDAVAGVVNFVLKNRMEGFTFDFHEGFSEYGDNVEMSPSFAWGHSFMDGRLHVMVGGDYTDNKGTRNFYSRPWGRNEPGLVTIAASSIPAAQRVALGLPANVFSDHVRTSAYNATGLIVSGPLKGTAFDDGGLTHAFNYGTLNGGTVTIGGGDYGSVLNPDEYIKADYNRAAALGRVEFDFTPTTVGYVQLGWGDLHTRGYSFGARVPNFNAYPVLNTNPFLPASVVAAMKTNNITQFAYSATRDFDLGSIHAFNRTETVQANAGLKGSFEAFGKDWKWDFNGGAGKATFAPDIHNTPITADFFESAYAVAGPNGTPVCGPIATNPYFNAQPAVVKAALISQVTPGCVPYNIFGNNLSSNQAAIAYFNSASQADFEFRQYTASLDFAGSPFSLPAGPVSAAVGLDWRRETLSSVNCPECQLGALMNQNYSLFSGAIEVKEAYAELGVPVFRDLPLIKRLDANGAVRETDYSTSGKVTTWKVGATWDIDDMVRLRLTRSHDIRAPNINELFNPGSEGNPQVTNPINNAQGFIKSNTVGNPNLLPEVGDTITGGIVFQPTWEWAQGIRASIDYWSIHLKNAIATLPIQNVINGCFAGDQSLCQYVVRDSTALGIARVNSPNLNLNAQKTDGFDLEFDYAVPLERLSLPGELTFRALGLYTRNAKSISSNLEINAVDTAASPRFVTSGFLTYTLGPARLNLTARYTSTIRYSTTLVGPDDPSYSVGAINSVNKNLWKVPVYWNGAFAYKLKTAPGRASELYVNVDNIFDKKPPIVAWVLNGGPYDLVGRSFKLGFRYSY
jgi:iron complex outermembrane receptor protein